MDNKLINSIKKVNSINYISNAYKSPKKEFVKLFETYKKEYNISVDTELEEFIIFVNGKMFWDWVVFKPVEEVPLFSSGYGDVGLFYSLKPGTQYDALTTMKYNSDIMNRTDFLLAEATPGDFIVISFDEADYGKLYFIGHDMDEDEQSRYLVANSVEEFISQMIIKED